MDRVETRDILTTIQMEYVEMPELKLTLRQAGRLWNVPVEECEHAFASLVRGGFLVQGRDGAFLRRDGAPITR